MVSLLFLLFLVLIIGIGIFTKAKLLRKENKSLVSEIKNFKNEIKYLGIALIIITILAIILNVEDVIFGGKASIFGFLSSFGVVVMWGLFYKSMLKDRKNNLILFSTVIWSLIFLTALGVLYENITENLIQVLVDLMIPFGLIFLTPLYGLGFIGESNHVITSIIILIIASVFIFAGLKFLIKNKENRNEKY